MPVGPSPAFPSGMWLLWSFLIIGRLIKPVAAFTSKSPHEGPTLPLRGLHIVICTRPSSLLARAKRAGRAPRQHGRACASPAALQAPPPPLLPSPCLPASVAHRLARSALNRELILLSSPTTHPRSHVLTKRAAQPKHCER